MPGHANSLTTRTLGGVIKRWNYQLVTITTIMVLFGALGALAAPQRKAMMICFSFISGSAFVWALFLAMAISQLGVEHEKLGVAGGLAGTFRMSGGVSEYCTYSHVSQCYVDSVHSRHLCLHRRNHAKDYSRSRGLGPTCGDQRRTAGQRGSYYDGHDRNAGFCGEL